MRDYFTIKSKFAARLIILGRVIKLIMADWQKIQNISSFFAIKQLLLIRIFQ